MSQPYRTIAKPRDEATCRFHRRIVGYSSFCHACDIRHDMGVRLVRSSRPWPERGWEPVLESCCPRRFWWSIVLTRIRRRIAVREFEFIGALIGVLVGVAINLAIHFAGGFEKGR